LHDEHRTVVIREAPPPVEVSTARVRPLVGGRFDPAGIYANRSGGVVTLYSVFGSGTDASAAQGSGFAVSRYGLILTNSHVITTAGADDVVRAVSERLRPGHVSTFTIIRDGSGGSFGSCSVRAPAIR
jgi:hypothetical protein